MSNPLVLVVDDDPDILEAICDILEVEDYRVAKARNGLEALQKVDVERPDAILLDLMMPVMDGVAFAHALHERPEGDVPIVVISADGNPQRAAAVGARAFLAKPFDIDTLLAHVGALTSERAPRAGA
jgi:two-component system chemotaxis response regulator CheY